MNDWPRVRLGDYCEVFSGYPFKSERFTDDRSGVPLVKGENVGQGRVLWDISKYWPGEDTDSLDRFRLRPGDVVLAMDRPWVPAGLKFARITQADPDSLLVQRVARLRATDGHLEQGLLPFIVGSPDFTAYVQNVGRGVGVPHISGREVGDYAFVLPPQACQRRIASILSAYDDLIENNRRRMALLEEAARQLYREWFVRLRFPGYEHTRVIDGVPQGWERKTLGELADITMGQSPESQYYNTDGEGLPFHQGVADFGERFVRHRVCCTAPNRIGEAGDILCSVRAPVGRLNMTLDRIVIGRGLAAIHSRRHNQSLLFQQLRAHFFKEDLIGAGAIFASVTKKELQAQLLLTPPRTIAEAYEQFSCPIDEQLRVLHRQNGILRSARDLLLPRLMSGEITVLGDTNCESI